MRAFLMRKGLKGPFCFCAFRGAFGSGRDDSFRCWRFLEGDSIERGNMIHRLRSLSVSFSVTATIAVFACIALTFSAAAQDVTLDSDTLSGLPIRAIGPAAKIGRAHV